MLEVGSDLVGLRSRPRTVELTARQTMNFAAAVGDNNPYYFDDLREDGIVAHPMLCGALTWPMIERYQDFWDAYVPLEVMQRQVHYTEHVLWHRPMRPDDRLSIQAELVSLRPVRGGALMTARYEATDAAGAVVFDEYSGALFRGVRCADGGKTVGALPEAPACPAVEAPLWEKRIPLDPLAAHIYDGCADITFPIHSSVRFAKFVGLPGIILQGTATLSMAVRELVNAEGGGDPTRLKSGACCFTGMVTPGSEIALRVKARQGLPEGTAVFFEVSNAAGKIALNEGHMIFAG